LVNFNFRFPIFDFWCVALGILKGGSRTADRNSKIKT
jgi:hypothetical protein